jgi:hypothetical protein
MQTPASQQIPCPAGYVIHKFNGPVDPEVLRVLQLTEFQLEHSKCI